MSAEMNNDGGLPMRWRDDPQTSPGLAALLASARADEPRADQLAALRTALGAGVADDELARHRAKRGRRPVILGVLLVAAAAATAVAVTRSSTPRSGRTVVVPVLATGSDGSGSGSSIVAGSAAAPATSRVIIRSDPPELEIFEPGGATLGQAPLGLTRPIGTTMTIACKNRVFPESDVPIEKVTVTWTAVDQVVVCAPPEVRKIKVIEDDKKGSTDKPSMKPSKRPPDDIKYQSDVRDPDPTIQPKASSKSKLPEPPSADAGDKPWIK